MLLAVQYLVELEVGKVVLRKLKAFIAYRGITDLASRVFG